MASTAVPLALPATIPLSSSLAVVAAIVFVGGYFLYQAALPKPIPGIPYVVASANSVLGDIPDMVKWQNERGEFWSFLTERCKQLNSPIVQVFTKPFGKPWVILCDYRESQDMMARRGKEFDRSGFLGDLFGAIAPKNHTRFVTGEEWRAHRRLMGDCMSQSFLQDVAAPQMHECALTMLDLWSEKSRLAPGYAFSASNDVFKGAMDALWGATFGSDISTTRAQVDLLKTHEDIKLPSNKDEAVVFPEAKDPAAFTALLDLAASVEIAVKSPAPMLTHSIVVNTFPSLRAATKNKNALLDEKLEASWQKFSKSNGDPGEIRHAIDLIVQRELTMSKKEGRKAEYNTQAVRDEIFGFLLAGNDTTSTTICWGLKFLSDHQKVQTKLRADIRAYFQRAVQDGDVPTAQEITKANMPYMDATIEEILRCAAPIPGNSRRAIVDAPVLGHVIPKGHDVLMLQNGPGYFTPSFPISDSQRHKSSLTAKDVTNLWSESDMADFIPERWLVTNGNKENGEAGEAVFDPRAGPMQAFGGGQRGCFGKKMAALTLRTFFTLILWKYELLAAPRELSGYVGTDKATHQPTFCYVRLGETKA